MLSLSTSATKQGAFDIIGGLMEVRRIKIIKGRKLRNNRGNVGFWLIEEESIKKRCTNSSIFVHHHQIHQL